jgi:hypothetical protein
MCFRFNVRSASASLYPTSFQYPDPARPSRRHETCLKILRIIKTLVCILTGLLSSLVTHCVVYSAHRSVSPWNQISENKYDEDAKTVQARASKIVHTGKEAIGGGTSSYKSRIWNRSFVCYLFPNLTPSPFYIRGPYYIPKFPHTLSFLCSVGIYKNAFKKWGYKKNR